MKLISLMGTVAALLLPAAVAYAATLHLAPRVGDTYEITLAKDFARQDRTGSSGSSPGKDTIVERVIGLRADGLELQYDLPDGATADERGRNWQLPAQVFKPFAGPAQLLNGGEIEARLDGWLKAAGLTRTACGQWIFTSKAFQLECDPQSVLKRIQSFDLMPADLRDGAPYRETEAGASGKLAKIVAGTDSVLFTVEMPVNPDVVRHTRAESDVAVGEINHKPVSLDEALRERAKEIVSGTISVAFETDAAGNVRRRTKVTKLTTTGSNGWSGTQTATETLERRLVSRRG